MLLRHLGALWPLGVPLASVDLSGPFESFEVTPKFGSKKFTADLWVIDSTYHEPHSRYVKKKTQIIVNPSF